MMMEYNNDWDSIWDIDPAGEYPTIPTNDMGDDLWQ